MEAYTRMIYRHKRTGQDIEFRTQEIDRSKVMKVARALCPKYCKLIKVETVYIWR